MAINEACQLWIEQRCQEELEAREKSSNPKSLRTIGRDIAAEILKYFEASISSETLRKRLERLQESGTNVPPRPTASDDGGNQENQSPSEEIKAPRQHRATGESKGGSREGAGRKPKYRYTETYEFSDAMSFATLAISQLERIRDDDPKIMEALNRVADWIIMKKEDLGNV